MKILNILIFIIISAFFVKAQTTADIYTQAMDAYYSQQYAESYRLFERFFKEYTLTDELYATAKFYSSDALLNIKQPDAAAAGFEFLINNFEWSNFRDRALYKAGLIYFDKGEYTKSRERFSLILNQYPNSEHTGSALYWIGETYTKQNNINAAISFLKEAVEKRKNNRFIAHSIYALASLYEKVGDYDNAVKYYDQLLSYYPDSPLASSARIRIGLAHFKLKNYQASILELKNPLLTELPPEQYSESLYLLANSYYRAKEYNDAEETYLEIIQNFPASEVIQEVKYGLAWTYFQQQKFNDAYKIFHFLSAGEDSIAEKSFFWKAEAKKYAGNESEAFDLYQEFLRKYPDSKLISDAQYQMGGVYLDSKNFNTAENYLKLSVESPYPNVRAKAYILLGEIDLNQKQYASARRNFESAVNIPEIIEEIRSRALLGLGASQYYTKQYKQAVQTLEGLSFGFAGEKSEQDKAAFYLAESYYSQNMYDKALQNYNNISSDNSELYPFALYGKGYCYFNLNDYANASYQFSEFVQLYPRDSKVIDAKLRLADSYYASKNFSAASKIYKEVFASGNISADPNAQYQYAQALFRAGNTVEAINEFRRLQQRFPNSEYGDRSLYIIGWIFFQQGDYTEAISQYRNVFSVYPNTSLGPILYYSMGDAYFNQDKYDSAIVNYQRVINRYPNSNYVFDAVNGFQYSYVAMGKPEQAVLVIDEFISRNPNVSFADQIFFKKGEIYYSIRAYEKAKTAYKEFIANYPRSSYAADAYYWIGKSAQNLNQNEEAIFNFNRVFDSYPKSEAAATAVIEIGNTYNSMNNYDEALNIYNQALDRLSNSIRIPEILYMKGITLVNKGDFSAAYEVFDELALYHKESIFADKARFELGLIEFAAKRYSNAENYFKSLADSRSDDLGAQAQYYYGLTLYEQGKIDEAISAFVRVRTVFSGYDEWLAKSFLKLGEAYTKLEDYEKAKEMYRAVLSKHRGDDYGKEAQSKLRAIQ